MTQNKSHENDSRRRVQRRFMPGTLGVDVKTSALFMVIGWIPTTTTLWSGVRPKGDKPLQVQAQEVRSHDAIILINKGLTHVGWSTMAVQWTLSEWNDAFGPDA